MLQALVKAYRLYWFYFSPSKLSLRRAIYRYLAPGPPLSRILDVGSGTGMMMPALRRACRPDHLVAADIDPSDKTDLVCDAVALPFPRATFDLVTAFEVLEHLPDTSRFLTEVTRVLAPEGRLVVSIPFLYGIHDHQDFYRFTPMGIRTTFAANGLETLALKKIGGTFMALMGILTESVRTIGIGPSEGWRARSAKRKAKLALTTVLALPFAISSWLAYVLDALLDRDSANPAGLLVIARRTGAGTTSS